MKRITNLHLPVKIGMNLDDVDTIKFKFQQGNLNIYYTYPSEEAIRYEDSNVILLKWTIDETKLLSEHIPVCMDTYIKLVDSIDNPCTPIIKFKIHPTLFTEAEVDTL